MNLIKNQLLRQKKLLLEAKDKLSDHIVYTYL